MNCILFQRTDLDTVCRQIETTSGNRSDGGLETPVDGHRRDDGHRSDGGLATPDDRHGDWRDDGLATPDNGHGEWSDDGLATPDNRHGSDRDWIDVGRCDIHGSDRHGVRWNFDRDHSTSACSSWSNRHANERRDSCGAERSSLGQRRNSSQRSSHG